MTTTGYAMTIREAIAAGRCFKCGRPGPRPWRWLPFGRRGFHCDRGSGCRVDVPPWRAIVPNCPSCGRKWEQRPGTECRL